MRYGCLKIVRCSKDRFNIGKQGITRYSGNTMDNATWDNLKLKCKGRLNF
jgi:hypothetical protein